MAQVDFERAWVALKAYAASRPSHGQRDLLSQIVRIELECLTDPEGIAALAQTNGHSAPLSPVPARSDVMDTELAPPANAKEARYGGKHRSEGRAADRDRQHVTA